MEQRVERAAKALAVVGRVAIGRRESGKGRRESGQREEGVRAGYHGGLGRISRWAGQDITVGWAGYHGGLGRMRGRPPPPEVWHELRMSCGG